MFLDHMKDLKNLERFVVDGAQIANSSFEIISTNCKSLVEIGVSKCVGVDNMGIIQLVSGCVDLKTINLTCCRSITDAAISAIADSCRSLLCLKLESCSLITEKGLYQLGSFCLRLQELDLTDCSGVNDKGSSIPTLVYVTVFLLTFLIYGRPKCICVCSFHTAYLCFANLQD